MRRPTDRLTAAELREIDDLEWRIASLDYDLQRLQNRDEYEQAEVAQLAERGARMSGAESKGL